MADSGTSHVSLSKELKKLLKQYPNLEVMKEKPRVINYFNKIDILK